MVDLIICCTSSIPLWIRLYRLHYRDRYWSMGLNRTINWGWDITNFVWWVGIGHAGTPNLPVLLLFRQRWRMSVNRSAEAMTIFAVVQAAIFPVIHMGRVWVGYWVFPLPNQFSSLWGTSTLLYFGTYLRSLRISQYQLYSGLWDLSLTLQ